MALDFHRGMNSAVNCACKVSRLHAYYENLMPDDLILHYGELYHYFIIYHNIIIIIEINCTINVMCLNCPETINPLPQSLVPKALMTIALSVQLSRVRLFETP